MTSAPIYGLQSAIPLFSYFLTCAFLPYSYAGVNLKPPVNFCWVWQDETNTSGSFVYTGILFWYTCRMDMLGFPNIQRTAFTVASLFDESDEKSYWLSKTPYERLQAVELMRRIIYGYDPSATRLQRVLEATQRSSG